MPRRSCILAAAAAFAALTQPTIASSSSPRRAMFWLEPYGNLTSVADYQSAWSQFGTNAAAHPGGYLFAGSCYALKHNGSLGYADTAAGEGLYGIIMEEYGFPALRSMNLTTFGLVYFTHEDGIAIVLQNPKPFVNALVNKAIQQHLHGIDLDYEPQGVAQAVARLRKDAPDASDADPFYTFLTLLGTELAKVGKLLSVDATTGCGGMDCPSYVATPGLLQVNTMDTFNVGSLSDFQACAASDLPGLGGQWAPGFEPGNFGDDSTFSDILTWASGPGNVTAIATWEVHECNVGPQPQWLFDAVNAFLEAP